VVCLVNEVKNKTGGLFAHGKGEETT